MTDWKPMATAPKDSPVLAAGGDLRSVTLVYYCEIMGVWSECGLDGVDCSPTHWMPLPEPPKED